jgi:DNA-binding transcriptional regulator PaaX
MEKSNTRSKKEKKYPPTDLILKILEGVGMLAVAFIAPNAVQLFDLAGEKRLYPRKQFRTALQRLKKKGYIVSASARNAWEFRLTDEGKKLLQKKHIDDIAISPPPQWDEKWRAVIFDIPEKYKHARNSLRKKLQALGFHYLNLSVWLYPYECQNEINAIVEYYGVGSYVRYMVVDSFDGMEVVSRKFPHLKPS